MPIQNFFHRWVHWKHSPTYRLKRWNALTSSVLQTYCKQPDIQTFKPFPCFSRNILSSSFKESILFWSALKGFLNASFKNPFCVLWPYLQILLLRKKSIWFAGENTAAWKPKMSQSDGKKRWKWNFFSFFWWHQILWTCKNHKITKVHRKHGCTYTQIYIYTYIYTHTCIVITFCYCCSLNSFHFTAENKGRQVDVILILWMRC